MLTTQYIGGIVCLQHKKGDGVMSEMTDNLKVSEQLKDEFEEFTKLILTLEPAERKKLKESIIVGKMLFKNQNNNEKKAS